MKQPAPPPKPSPVPPDDDHVTITDPDTRLYVGFIEGKRLHPAYSPLPVGLRIRRNFLNEYRTTCTSPEEYHSERMAGGENGDGPSLGAVQLNQPLRWGKHGWRRARELTPEALQAEAQASLAGERALNEQRDVDRAEEDARFAEVIASARDRHASAIELEKARMRVNAERSDDEHEAAIEHYRQESVDLGLEGLEPEPIKRPRDLSGVYAKAAKPAPAQPTSSRSASSSGPQAAKPKPAPKQPSKPVKKPGKPKGK